MQGFKTVIQDPVTILVGVASSFNATMEVGEVTEEIIVEGGITGLNTIDATIGDVIDNNQLQNLPINSRDPAGLLSLQPGVTFVPGQSDSPGGYSGISNDDGRSGSVNGARSDQTNITLDGVDVNDSQNGFAFSSALRATQASLQEFRVTTSNANADQGRSGAAQVQLVTKSGTNDVHGEVYYTHKNEALGANSFFNNRDSVEKAKTRRHIYGAALGGPVVKDRFFLFGNFERMEELIADSATSNVPSMAYRDGVIQYECAPIDPGPDGDLGTADDVLNPVCAGNKTILGLTGSHIVGDNFMGLTPLQFAAIDPAGIGINPNIISYFAGYPVPNSSGSRDSINIQGFRFNSPVNNDYKTYIARADFNVDTAGNHTLFVRGTLTGDSTVSSAATFPGNPVNQVELANNRGIGIGYKAVLSSTMVNQFRYGYTRIGEAFAGVRSSEFLDLRFISDLSGFDGASSTRTRKLPTHHIRDSISWSEGNHTYTFGGEARWTRNDRTTNSGAFNNFTTNPSWLPNVGRNTRPGSTNCWQSASNPSATSTGCDDVPAVSGGFGSSWNDTAPQLLGVITASTGNFNFLADGTVLASGQAIPRRFAVNEFEFFGQDTWRVTPTLTLTLGFRYYNSTPPWETNGNQVAPQMISRIDGTTVIPGGLSEWFRIREQTMLAGGIAGDVPQIGFTLGGPANNAEHFFPRDNNNWAPRLAAAWNPQIDNALFGNGKLVIRGGYALMYDRVGQGLASSFNSNGSFGMATQLTSTFGGCDEGQGTASLGACPRWGTGGVLDTTPGQVNIPTAPTPAFPAVPPDLFDISQALSNDIRNPKAHTYDVAISRDLGNNFVFEIGYVGRQGRGLLISQDLAMPFNLTDPASGIDYFQATRDLIQELEAGTDINTLAPHPFWENLFTAWGPGGLNSSGTFGAGSDWEGGYLVCDIQGVYTTAGPDGILGTDDDIPFGNYFGGFSATQVAYDFMNCMQPDTTFAPWVIDQGRSWAPAFMTCNQPDITGDGFGDCPEAFFNTQFATLAAYRPIARSEYHSLQASFRRRLSNGLQFTLNYVFSHSLDHSSEPERQGLFGSNGNGTTGFLVNSWNPELDYATSNFDITHQLNANYYYEIPIGQGRNFGPDMNSVLNNIIGGWQISGIFRANSGLPAAIENGRVWATNWNVSGTANCTGGAVPDPGHSTVNGACPATQNVKDTVSGDGPNLFRDPDAALNFYRNSIPGERGLRNNLRADNYMNFDFSLSKRFTLPGEGRHLKFQFDMFNVTNSVFFDSRSLSGSLTSTASFGNYTEAMGREREMQMALQFVF